LTSPSLRISSTTNGSETLSCTYDATWKDKLASYDGASISYDNIGNPTDDGTWEYTWTQGRKLQQMTDGSTTLSFKYNSSGIRTEKTVGGTTTKYNIAGGKITWEKTGANNPIYYLYDSAGSLWGLKYTDGNTYFYVYNAQGDIIKILNSSGDIVVEYGYDAWGKPIYTSGSMAATLGADNPFLYRAYYYDDETGLYYLESRYYNPEWGRFINADEVIDETGSLITHNVFAYCLNNPVMYYDPNGAFAAVFAGIGSVGVAGQLVIYTGLLLFGVIVVESIIFMSKGGKQRIRDSGLEGYSDDEISRRLKDPRTPKSEKEKLKKEQKARGTRNKQKRGNKK